VREAFAARLAELEHRVEDALEEAAVVLPEIASAIQNPDAGKAKRIADAAMRLRQAGRLVDAELVIVTARQTPVASDLRLVLALFEVAHRSVLLANQFELISEQLASIDAAVVDRGGIAADLAVMAHLAGSQLCQAVGALASRNLDQAKKIDVEDDELDRLNRHIFEVAARLEDASEQRELALRHLLIARSIERIGDNAVDIAEQAAFVITAKRGEFTDASAPRSRTLQGRDGATG
jgi:phosphate transport system protein